jgi:hypothetical protein
MFAFGPGIESSLMCASTMMQASRIKTYENSQAAAVSDNGRVGLLESGLPPLGQKTRKAAEVLLLMPAFSGIVFWRSTRAEPVPDVPCTC